jgi:hypothetical protein
VATYSTGITVTWNSVTFTEVNALSWQYGGTRQDRGAGTAEGWTPEPGSVTFTFLGSTGATTSNFGKRGQLTITGGGVAYSGFATFESLGVQAELNGITRYTITLKTHG